MKSRYLGWFIVLLYMFYGLSSAFAQTTDKDVRNFVESNASRILKILQGDMDKEAKHKELSHIFEDIVDINGMARSASGSYWHDLSDQEKKDYLSAYHSYLVSLYAPKFSQYHQGSFQIKSIDAISANKYIIHTKIGDNDSDKSYDVSYLIVVDKSNGKLYIVDIIAANISLIATQRSDFAAIISKDDGILELIRLLRNRSSTAIARE